MRAARVHHAARRRGGGVAAAARAQQPAMPVIGFLSSPRRLPGSHTCCMRSDRV